MDADDVIDSYVHDVARRLPPSRRDDVAFELRALLVEDLHHRAEGREPDAGTALGLVRSIGRPAETAARYHEPFTLIRASDTWSFVVGALGGAALLSILTAPRTGESFAAATQRTNVAVLAWLGLLVVLFTIRSLILRRWPRSFPWKPRPVRDRSDTAGRVSGAAFLLGWAALLAVYLAPGPIVAALTGGRVGEQVLAYSGSFRDELRMPWLVGLVLAIMTVHVIVVVRGRWSGTTRWARLLLHASTAIQLGWHARYGAIFEDPGTDRALVPVVGALAGALMIVAWVELYRELTRVRPAPRAGMATGPDAIAHEEFLP
jgi:hypothetical protein